jgi:hypothetical protein
MVYSYVQSQFLGTGYAYWTVVRELSVCFHLTDISKSYSVLQKLRGDLPSLKAAITPEFQPQILIFSTWTKLEMGHNR